MAVLTGALIAVDNGSSINPLLSEGLSSFEADYWPTHESDSGVVIGGVYTDNLPVSTTPRVLTGAKTKSFEDDFYDQIHINPRTIDISNLVDDEEVPIEVWNAYRTGTRTLNSVDVENNQGMTLQTPALPLVMQSFQAESFTLTAGQIDTPQVRIEFNLLWVTPDDNSIILVIGSRLAVLPFQFSAPAEESLEWKTEIITSKNGAEQRTRLRGAPRQRLSVNYPLSPQDGPLADNLLFGRSAKAWQIGMWTEAQNVGALSASAATIDIDTRFSDYREGGLALVWGSSRENELVRIADISDSQLTLDTALVNNYASAWVMPTRVGLMENGTAKKSTNGYRQGFSVNLVITDNIRVSNSASPVQFLSEDVLLDEIFTSEEGANDEYFSRQDKVDFEVGPININLPWAHGKIRRQYEVIVEGMEAIWNFRQWLHRRAGKVRPFWQPTFENNIRLAQTGTIVDQFVAYTDEYDSLNPMRDHLAFKLTDGSWELRTVIDVSDGGSGTSIIGIDTALNVDASEIAFISFLGSRRLGSDRIVLKWLGNRVVSASIPIVEIKP